MATGANAIATELEVKTAMASTATVTGNKCCTKARAIEIGVDRNILSAYSDNLLIKYQDVASTESATFNVNIAGIFGISNYSSYKSFSMNYTLEVLDHKGVVINTSTGTTTSYLLGTSGVNFNPFDSTNPNKTLVGLKKGLTISTGNISTGIASIRCKVELYGIAASSGSSSNSNLITYGYGNVTGSRIKIGTVAQTEYYAGQYYLLFFVPSGSFNPSACVSFLFYESDTVYNNTPNKDLLESYLTTFAE